MDARSRMAQLKHLNDLRTELDTKMTDCSAGLCDRARRFPTVAASNCCGFRARLVLSANTPLDMITFYWKCPEHGLGEGVKLPFSYFEGMDV